MNFPAIANRELLARSRHWATYRNRTVAALVGVGIVIIMLVIAEVFSSLRTIGATMFVTLSWLGFCFCLFEGLRNTVDCLSSEKRDGTLGLLFLTELNGFDVVTGKLAVNSVTAFYSLLAAFPALAMPFVLGGITAGEFWRMLLALLNTLFFALAVGMLVSASGRDERGVWTAGLALVGFLTVGLPVIDLVLAGGDPAKVSPLFGLLSPKQAFSASADLAYSLVPGVFWSALGFTHFASWLMLVLAGMILSRTWHETEVRAPGRFEKWLSRVFIGSIEGRSLERLRGQNPVYWLGRLNSQPRFIYVLLAGGFGLSLLLLLMDAKSPTTPLTVMVICWVLHWFLRIWVAAQACNTMSAFRESGMLELTLVSPVNSSPTVNYLSSGGIANAMARALQHSFWVPVGFLALSEIVLLGLMLGRDSTGAAIFSVLVWLVAFAILWLDLNAVTYTGLWYGLTARKATTAITRTVVNVLVLPLLLVVVMPFGLLFCGPGIPILFIVKALLFSSNMRDRLYRRLAVVASEPLEAESQAPWWWPFGREKRKVIPPPMAPPPLPAAQTRPCVSCIRPLPLGTKKCPYCGWMQPWQ